jgi:hypothetical protein
MAIPVFGPSLTTPIEASGNPSGEHVIPLRSAVQTRQAAVRYGTLTNPRLGLFDPDTWVHHPKIGFTILHHSPDSLLGSIGDDRNAMRSPSRHASAFYLFRLCVIRRDRATFSTPRCGGG